MFGDGDNIGASYFGDGDTAIGFVGGVKVDMVGSDTCCDGNLELLCFGETFRSEVSWVETLLLLLLLAVGLAMQIVVTLTES